MEELSKMLDLLLKMTRKNAITWKNYDILREKYAHTKIDRTLTIILRIQEYDEEETVYRLELVNSDENYVYTQTTSNRRAWLVNKFERLVDCIHNKQINEPPSEYMEHALRRLEIKLRELEG